MRMKFGKQDHNKDVSINRGDTNTFTRILAIIFQPKFTTVYHSAEIPFHLPGFTNSQNDSLANFEDKTCESGGSTAIDDRRAFCDSRVRVIYGVSMDGRG